MRLILAAACALLLPGTALARADAVRWTARLDLRELPANTRPASVGVEVDARRAARAGLRPTVAIAVNGIVVGRTAARRTTPTRMAAPLQGRLLSVRNRVEVSLSAECGDDPCRRLLSATPAPDTIRFTLGKPEAGVTDLSQIVTRLRPGIAFRSDGGALAGPLAAQLRAALAPHAPADPRAAATVLISRAPPAWARPPLRFDLGPVRLQRSDGATILPAAAMASITAVQLIRGGDRPIVWVRPADDGSLPPRMEIDQGDVALFDRAGRVIGFSTRRDRAVRIAHAPGVDADGAARATAIWRLSLLSLWLAVSVALFLFWRRLPRPARAVA